MNIHNDVPILKDPGGGSVELNLSGGGFRAMLFHLGVLKRINDMELLPDLDGITSVSAGALTAGRLAVAWPRLKFVDGIARNFDDEVTKPLLQLATRHIDVTAFICGLIPFVSAAGVAARLYDHALFSKKTISDLPMEPDFTFNATHLGTLSIWRFNSSFMGSHRLGVVVNPQVKVATAVAASAAYLPFLSPMTLKVDKKSLNESGTMQFRRGNKAFNKSSRIDLSDGGILDNLGLGLGGKKHVGIQLISDAGGAFQIDYGRYRSWGKQLRRALDIATNQARREQRENYTERFKNNYKTGGAAWHINSNIESFPIKPHFEVHPHWRYYLGSIRTRLNPFTTAERSHLVNWGYLVSDLAIRSFIDPRFFTRRNLLNELPFELPFPEFDFKKPPPFDSTDAEMMYEEEKRVRFRSAGDQR